MSIALFVNPHSRANRRNPGLAGELAAILGETGRLLTPGSLDELAQAAAALRRDPPSVIAVHGGDGSLHKTLTALLTAWGDAPLPPIATLCGGTMNVVASSLGLRARPEAVLRMLAEGERAGRRPAIIRRRCMKIGPRWGFVFGNGLAAHFLEEYYTPKGYGPARAVWLLFRCVVSALVQGPFVRRVFRGFQGRVAVDGVVLPRDRFTTVSAATVREVGMGFKLNHRADDDPERFGVLAVHAGPLALALDVPAVHAGRGVAPSRAFSGVASRLDIEPRQGEMSYTIDGDLYRDSGPLTITVGPPIDLVRPVADGGPAGLPAAADAATLPSMPLRD